MSVTAEAPSIQTSEVADHLQEQYVPKLVPDVSRLLSDAIVATNAENDDPLRRALQAESRGENNTELEAVVDTIVGIKLLGMQRNDEQLIAHAETIFLDALTGDEQAEAIAESALEEMRLRNPAEARKDVERRGFSSEPWFTEESFAERYTGSEQLDYGHLSIVHATGHEPRKGITDGMLHIDDRFTATGGARSTVHVALNHMVESDGRSADWSSKRVIVVAPMDRVVQLNGEPSTLVGHDTWWETQPGDGLVLPEDAIVIKPGASKPVQVLESGKEIRYKADGITAEDTDVLFEMADDYELTQTARLLGIDLNLSYNHRASGELAGTSLAQYQTQLSVEQRERIRTAIGGAQPELFQRAFTDLAKRVAVRLAVEAQGREVIEPRTTMDSNFLSKDLDNEVVKLAFEHGATAGHHSESIIGRLEDSIRDHVHRGVFSASHELKESIAQRIRENIDQIDKSTLHMYYRLGLI